MPSPLDFSPRALLFDLDDTLCDYATARDVRLRFALSLDASGRPANRQEVDIERMIAASLRTNPHGVDHFGELFAEFGIDDGGAARAAADWYRANRFHGLRLFPETEAVLRSVRAIPHAAGGSAGRVIGVVTNGPTDVQRDKIEHLGVRELLDFVIISDEFGVAKPDPAIFAEALRRAGARADEALFVGDSPEFDIVGAQASGIEPVWLNRGENAWDHSISAPVREIRSLEELRWLLNAFG